MLWLYRAIVRSYPSLLYTGATLHLIIGKVDLFKRNVSLVYLSIVFYVFRGWINGDTTRR